MTGKEVAGTVGEVCPGGGEGWAPLRGEITPSASRQQMWVTCVCVCVQKCVSSLLVTDHKLTHAVGAINENSQHRWLF